MEDITQTPAPSEQPEKENKFDLKKELFDFAKMILTAFVIAYVLTHFFILNCIVPTGSMLDTIQLDDHIIGNRLSYVFSEPERGDIVMFYCPDNESKIYIKRLIGLPGDTVLIQEGKIYINGSDTPLDEPYLNESAKAYAGSFEPFVVPEDSYFFLGDNRANSWDARYWTNTYVSRKKILAKAKFVYYPFKNIKWL